MVTYWSLILDILNNIVISMSVFIPLHTEFISFLYVARNALIFRDLSKIALTALRCLRQDY